MTDSKLPLDERIRELCDDIDNYCMDEEQIGASVDLCPTDGEWVKIRCAEVLGLCRTAMNGVRLRAALRAQTEAQPVLMSKCPMCDTEFADAAISKANAILQREREAAHPPLREPEDARGDILAWAVERWNAEVKYRPLCNIHRRSLDDAWRQVMRRCGGDPEALVGPSHDDRLALSGGKHGT